MSCPPYPPLQVLSPLQRKNAHAQKHCWEVQKISWKVRMKMSILFSRELLNICRAASQMWVSISLVPPLNLCSFCPHPIQSNYSLSLNPDAPLILVHRRKGLEVNRTPPYPLRRQFKIINNYFSMYLGESLVLTPSPSNLSEHFFPNT